MPKLQRVEKEILVKIFKQTFWQMIGKLVSSASTLIILGMVARVYQESGTGVFTLSLTYLAVFNLLSDFGFNAHIMRGAKVKWQKLLGTRIIWSIFLLILAVGLLPFWPFAQAEFIQAVIFGILAIVGFAIFTSCNLIFQKQHRYDLSVVASSTGTLVGLTVFILLSFFDLPVAFMLFPYLVSWIVISMTALFLLRRLIKNILPIFDLQYTISLFKDSWPIAVTLALNVVYFRADSFIISFYQGNHQAGIYNVAYAVFQAVLVLPTFMMNAYYPLMLKSYSKMKLVAVWLVTAAIFGTVLIFSLAPRLINILTGAGFEGSSDSLQILSLSFPAFYLSSLLMLRLITKGRYKLMLAIYTVGLIFNLILNFAYIPQFSYLAASWITVFSEYLILGMLAASLKK